MGYWHSRRGEEAVVYYSNFQKKKKKVHENILVLEGLRVLGQEEVTKQKGIRQNWNTAVILVYMASGFGGVVCVYVMGKY